jgi:replication factor A1
VSEFNNVSLGTDRNVTKLIYNPEGIQEAEAILKWRDHFYDPGNPTTRLSVRCTYPRQREFRTLRSVNEEWQTCTNTSAADVFLVRAHINFIKHDETAMWYSSCFNADKCKKKVTKEGEIYRCDTCAETAESCVYRYIVSMKICDETDGIWVSAFDEKFTEIIGITANDLKRIQDESAEDYKEKVAMCLNQRLEFVIRATMQEGGGALRPKFAIQAVNQVDHRRLIKTLLSDLAVMMSLQASTDY